MGPSHGVQSCRNRLLQHGSPTGSQVLPANLLRRGLLSPRVRRSWQEAAPARAPHGVTASFRHPPAPAWGPFHRLQVDICSTVALYGLHRNTLPHHGLQHKLQGKTLCSSVSSTSSPPSFFTDLGVAELFLSHHLTPVSQMPSHHSFFLLLLLKHVIPEALPPSLVGLTFASGGSVLEPTGPGFIRHGGSFSQLLTEATPIARLLPKLYHVNP